MENFQYNETNIYSVPHILQPFIILRPPWLQDHLVGLKAWILHIQTSILKPATT